HMSLTRRLSLLAGSSLFAAGLAALAPTSAAAQVTCVTPPAPVSGNGTNAAVYGSGTHNPGITCTFVGSGANVSTNAAITVSTTGGAPGDPLINGVNLRAIGTDSIN